LLGTKDYVVVVVVGYITLDADCVRKHRAVRKLGVIVEDNHNLLHFRFVEIQNYLTLQFQNRIRLS
jgi:hypothetical protein